MRRCPWLAVLLVALAFGMSPAFASDSLKLEFPAFALSGIPFDLKIGHLPADSGTLTYAVTLDGEVVQQGEKPAADLQKLSLTAPRSGRGTWQVTVGGRNGNARLRVLPGWTCILPPLVAIFLALVTREVLTSLFLASGSARSCCMTSTRSPPSCGSSTSTCSRGWPIPATRPSSSSRSPSAG